MPYYDDYLDSIREKLVAGHRQWKRGDKILDAFGYTRRRQTAIDLIKRRLKAKGMSTDPEISTSMPLDRAITFYLIQAKSQSGRRRRRNGNSIAAIRRSRIELDLDDDPPSTNEETPDLRALIIGNLACAEREPLQIAPSETVERAMTEMALNDYSQLVVTTGRRTIRGIISYKSIAQAYLHGSPETVNDCLDKSVPTVERSEPLLRVIERFNQFDVVLVVADDKGPAGIVTPADIAAEFGAMAAPFFLIGQIEEQLRWLVKEKLDLSSALTAAAVSNDSVPPTSVIDMTMGDLHRLLSNDGNWRKVGIKFDRQAFCKELDVVRDIRNAVMHFRDIQDGAAERVKKFAGIVQTTYIAAIRRNGLRV